MNAVTVQSPHPSPSPPTPLAKRFVRYFLGFGVGVALGLAPYLGVLEIPLFKPLLSLIPETIQNTAIPLSSALMGLLAIIVQWYGTERIARKSLRKAFRNLLIATLGTFFALLIFHTVLVSRVPIRGGRESVSFVVGFSRPVKPPCTAEVSDSECIKLLTLNPSAVESFWGDRQTRLASLILVVLYLLFTGCIGGLVGFLLLKEVNLSKGRGSLKQIPRENFAQPTMKSRSR